MRSIERSVLVTGGAQGIGRGIVEFLLARNIDVAALDIDQEAGRELLEKPEGPGKLIYLAGDVRDEASICLQVAEVLSRFGRLDGLVNCAGIADPHALTIEDLPLADWQNMIATNLTGCFLMAKHCIPALRATGGAIVNISSTRALQSEANTEAYAAAKGGLLSLTHAMAISLSGQIRVNCISPGWIDVRSHKKRSKRTVAELSEMDHQQHPAGRVGRPEDVAAMTAFLLSDEAGFITGQNFVVDGGMTRKMIYVEE